MTHDYWTKFGNSCNSDRSSNSIWLNALLHLLTHNDFYPALVGEQTLTRSVILHNNYQEKETSFIIEIVFSENQPWVMFLPRFSWRSDSYKFSYIT